MSTLMDHVKPFSLAVPFLFLLNLFAANGVGQEQELGSQAIKKALKNYQAHIVRSTRIFGGSDATLQDNPWQVALVLTAVSSNANAQFCGGSVVAARWVITAAHCVDAGTKASQIAVLVGTASLESGGKRVDVEDHGIFLHEHWNFSTHENDIALIKVTDDLPGQPIGPWALPAPENENRDVRITGWGALSWQNSPPMSILLQGADTQVVSLVKCNASDSYDGALYKTMLCIGKYNSGQKDTCDRDSGGPATTEVDGKRELIGITSWGPPKCGTPKMPGIYTRVSQYRGWVRKTSNNAVNW